MEPNRIVASVVIPVFNQAEALYVVLKFFNMQTINSENFEIIIVDDGSTDERIVKDNSEFWPKLNCDVTWIHKKNEGRAVARNAGVKLARGEIIIFCDSDRFPEPDFVQKHINAINQKSNIAVVGCPWDYFGNDKNLNNDLIQWDRISKFSRIPQYYKKISKIFDKKGQSESPISWASFLVGNSCIKKEHFVEVNGFDSDFVEWGFEHFEFGFRLYKYGLKFNMLAINNYHIPHPRSEGFYKNMIEHSTKLIQKKHNDYNFYMLREFLYGNICLQDFEDGFNFKKTENSVR